VEQSKLKMKLRLTLLSPLLLISQYCFCQDIFPPDPVKKTIKATKIEAKLNIDGELDEPEWLSAEIIKDFIEQDPVQGVPAKKETVVRLLYNKNFLYMGVICYDSVGRNKYRALNLRRDFSAANSDFFAIAIDGYNDERNAVMFGMNPYGAQRDLLSFDDNYYDPDWDGLWTVRTQRTDTAWIAEVAIPWKTLRYRGTMDSLQTWGLSFGRISRGSNEISGWPAFPRAFGGLRMAYAGKLIDLEAPKPPTNIRVQPYLLYGYNDSKHGSTTIQSKSTFKLGADVKWALNPNTLLDLTVNTDFAQADVDRKVNNVNRFSVFYPEKRQFFLENAGLFTVGMDPLSNSQADYSTRIQPFFSRAIGIDADGSPLNLAGGARIVYRSDTRNAGGLFIRQQGNAATNPAIFFVGRYSQNLGKQNRIGTLISYKNEDTRASVSALHNLTGTVDGFFRFSQKLSESFMGSATFDSKSKSGYAVSSQLFYNSNKWVAWWNQSIVSAHYDPRMGFVARGNTIVTDPGIFLQERGQWLPEIIRTYGPGISYTTYHNATTLALTDRYLNINPVWFQFQNGGIISWYLIFTKQNLEEGFSPLNVPISKGIYSYIRHKISLSSDPSRKISASITGNLGQFYNGSYNSLSAVLSFAPVPNVFLSPGVEVGKLNKVGINQVSKNVNLYTIEGRIALNPQLQLSGLFQQTSESKALAYNTWFSWEFKPLSYLYIVFNNKSLTSDNGTLPSIRVTDRQIITKISYLKQF
jgi:hypothetical protein